MVVRYCAWGRDWGLSGRLGGRITIRKRSPGPHGMMVKANIQIKSHAALSAWWRRASRPLLGNVSVTSFGLRIAHAHTRGADKGKKGRLCLSQGVSDPQPLAAYMFMTLLTRSKTIYLSGERGQGKGGGGEWRLQPVWISSGVLRSGHKARASQAGCRGGVLAKHEGISEDGVGGRGLQKAREEGSESD